MPRVSLTSCVNGLLSLTRSTLENTVRRQRCCCCCCCCLVIIIISFICYYPVATRLHGGLKGSTSCTESPAAGRRGSSPSLHPSAACTVSTAANSSSPGHGGRPVHHPQLPAMALVTLQQSPTPSAASTASTATTTAGEVSLRSRANVETKIKTRLRRRGGVGSDRPGMREDVAGERPDDRSYVSTVS